MTRGAFETRPRGKRAGGAFGNYKAGLQSLAGMTTTAGNALSNAAGDYGATAGGNMAQIGQLQGNKSMALYNNWRQFCKNALSGWV